MRSSCHRLSAPASESTRWVSQAFALRSTLRISTPYTAPVAPVMPTISRFCMAGSLPVNAMLVVFGPFAAGYFLSFFFRNVNAVISKDLATEFSLSASDLGFLTSMYLLAFAAFQLPLGVLLDRYGPRRVVAALLCVAAAGALICALARDCTMQI